MKSKSIVRTWQNSLCKYPACKYPDIITVINRFQGYETGKPYSESALQISPFTCFLEFNPVILLKGETSIYSRNTVSEKGHLYSINTYFIY